MNSGDSSYSFSDSNDEGKEKKDNKLKEAEKKQLEAEAELEEKEEEKKADEEENRNMILLGLRAPNKVETERKAFMLYPNDCIKLFFWDILQSIILLITCVLTPFNMAFSN